MKGFVVYSEDHPDWGGALEGFKQSCDVVQALCRRVDWRVRLEGGKRPGVTACGW